jgi:hypothetical protein
MKKLTALICLVVTFSSPGIMADVSDEEVQALREQIRMLSERLDQLENANRETAAAVEEVNETVTAQVASTVDHSVDAKVDEAVSAQFDERLADVSWAERMRWSGDFRYRYESIKVEDADTRRRNRIRARAALTAVISPTMKVGLGLASGGDDPVSTNQTLGGGGSTKPINLDLAYFDWSGLTDTHVLGGKFKNQLHRTGGNGLLWDGDWRPEGAAIRWDNSTFFASGIGAWVESDTKSANEEFSFGLNAGFNIGLGENAKLTAGVGYFQFDTAGKKSFFGDGDFFGNSFDPVTNRYLYDYHEIEAFAELGFGLFDRPAKLFVDYVQNQDAPENDTGYAFGFKFGKAKGRGTWDLTYVYQDLEADAVLGLLTDSDFGGGGTDAKGSIFKGTYAFHDSWNFKLTYFLNEINQAGPGVPLDFDRLQLDLNFKYK